MGSESTILPIDHAVDDNAVDDNDTETSEVVNSDSSVIEEEGNSVSEEVILEAALGNKEGMESPGTVCDLENNSSYVVEAIAPNGVALELPISCNGPDESLSVDCQTPRASIFDPFAPGQEEALCNAPKKKMSTVSEVISRRQLNFEVGDLPVKRLCFDLDGSEEEDLYLQGIHNMFVDLIISNQLKEAGGQHQVDGSAPGSFKTPVSKPLLTGIADTCPDAPLRPSLKLLKLSPSICRKLDFGAVSPKSLFVEDNKR